MGDVMRSQDEYLTSFSNALDPNYAIIKRWKGMVHWLIEKLKIEFRNIYKIDRHVIGGSVQKNTAILEPDLDCVLFFNNFDPPFQNVLQNFNMYLKTLPSVAVLHVTNYSIRLLFEKEVYVDLLPACNLVQRPVKPRHIKLTCQERIEFQRFNTLKELNRHAQYDSEIIPYYSSSLTESQLDFMRDQSEFVFIIVKLVKFWYKTVCCGNGRSTIPGLKYLMELVAVYWAQQEETESSLAYRSPSVTQAIIKIFGKLSDLDSLTVMFHGGERLSQTSIQNLIVGASMPPGDYYVSRSILDRQCFVMDPSNPFNDVLNSVKKISRKRGSDVLQAMELYAHFSLQCVTNCYTPDSPLSALFINRSFRDLKLSKDYSFILLCTSYPDWIEYIDMKKMIAKKSGEFEINAIDTAFQTGTAIEGFKYLPQLTVNSHILFALDDILTGIGKYMTVQPKMKHLSYAERMFLNGTTRRYVHHHDEVKSITDRVQFNGHTLCKVLQAPIWEDRDVRVRNIDHEPFESTTLYCCTMLLFR